MDIDDIKHQASTPMMAQYLRIKSKYNDSLLFYRMGDFYELFFEDAEIASAALNITLTKRGKVNGKDIAMCGVPYHSSENYLLNLIRQGHKVAICEQLEKPEEAKKRGYKSVVKRDVVRLVTPGTLTEESLLDGKKNNYLLAYCEDKVRAAAAWADLSTGEFSVSTINKENLDSLISRINPTEILVSEKFTLALTEGYNESGSKVTILGESEFDHNVAKIKLEKLCSSKSREKLKSFNSLEMKAIGGLISYLEITQCGEIPTLKAPVKDNFDTFMQIDSATRKNLELTQSLSGGKSGSLLNTINQTVTGGGSRLLERRLSCPLVNSDEINHRLDIISFFSKNQSLIDKLRLLMKKVPDIERALARLGLNRGGPKDLGLIRDGLFIAEQIHKLLYDYKTFLTLSNSISFLSGFKNVLDSLNSSLQTILPPSSKSTDFIKPFYNSQLDEFRKIKTDSKKLIINLQNKYIMLTKINSLKIKFNNVLGYFIETPSSHSKTMLSEEFLKVFTHRQTTTNSVRFTTQELSDLAANILNAESKAYDIETKIFNDLVFLVLENKNIINLCANSLAEIDFSSSISLISNTFNWVRPIINDSTSFRICGGRHPVVEYFLNKNGSDQFISNDCDLDTNNASILLLTGPNMAGKSTFLRQNALITILAQMGCFVPAKSANIGIVDQIFSRVGASDDLARGLSTFMLEMVETATILSQASPKALVIMDEIGRGTATYDGLSIAWATLEHIHNVIKCRTLFATHYHELTFLEETHSKIRNAKVAIKEWNDEIIFLHEVKFGKADKSYGLHVAKLAGIPKPVVDRAAIILNKLEKASVTNEIKNQENMIQKDITTLFSQNILDKLENLDTDNITPKEALQILDQLSSQAKEIKN